MLADFEKIQDKHILLQELFELGVFLDPEDVDAFIDDKKVPSSFYTATDVDGIPALTSIDPSNEKHQALYKKIIDVLEAYETKEGVEFTNKADLNIIEQFFQSAQLYRKTVNDSRTLKDLAKEYGFNVEETSEVDVKELLQKIIDSDYGRPHDKILARRLLASIPETFTIQFNRNHGVGVSHDSTNGVIVNPNFSSKNYIDGFVALESYILNGIMQKLAVDNLSNEKFKTAIEKIKNQVSEALANGQLDEIIAELKDKYKIDFTDVLGRVVVNNIAGMRSLEQFVAMAMTDPAFQSLLANVTVEETQKTLWEEFLDAVKSLVQVITGMAPGTTALQETINLTTAALTGSDITTTTEEKPVATKPTVTTPLNSMPEELRTALQTAWGALSQEDKSGYADISEWVKGSSVAAGLIAKYNKKTTEEEEEKLTDEELKLAALTPQQLNYLRNKAGLNDKDIFAMSIEDLVEIADGKFRLALEGETISEPQKAAGKMIKSFNGIKMTNVEKVGFKFTEDPVIADKLKQVGIKLEEILSNVLGRPLDKRVSLLNDASTALAESIINQIKAVYNIKDLEFTEQMGNKIRFLLSDNSTYFFRVTSLIEIVDDIRESSKEELNKKLSEAIENLLKKGPGTEVMKIGADRGLVLDEFFRLTLQGTLNVVIEDAYVTNFLNQALENTKAALNISEEVVFTSAAIAELRQTLEHVVAYMKENNLRALTSTNELFGNIGVMPVSGQVDLIVYNDKGEIFILDIKTMNPQADRANLKGYKKEFTKRPLSDRYGYARKDTVQLNIYRELIQKLVGAELQNAGMKIKGLGIIPILVTASLNKENVLQVSSVEISPSVKADAENVRGLYIPVLEKTSVELFPELYAQAPPAQPPASTSSKEDDIEKRRQEQLETLISEINIADNRRPNGSIGTQGFTPESLKSLVEFLNKELSFNIPSDILSQESLKPLIEYIKSNQDLVSKIKDHIKKDPVEVNYLPDGTIHFQDGNHRANLLNLIGAETIPSIEVGQKENIDKINAKYDAEYVDAVKKGEMTKEQAMQALEEVGRKDSEAYAELAALEGGGQQSPTSTSVINQEILNEYAGQVIYVSPGIKISKELANDPYVILYDDYIIELLNINRNELEIEEVTRETLYKTLGDIYSNKKESVKSKLNALLEQAYEGAINALEENPEKILITQSRRFTKENSDQVAIAIVQENIEEYTDKSLVFFEQQAFRKDSRLKLTSSNNLLEVFKNSLNDLSGQRKLTDKSDFAIYEEFVKNASFDSLILLRMEIDTMTDSDFVFKNNIQGLEAKQEYLRKLVDDQLKTYMREKGITSAKELLKVAKEGDIVIMDNKTLYPLGYGVVTKNGNIKALYYDESSGDNDFKNKGYAPTPANKVVAVKELADVLEEDATTEDENLQATENREQATLTREEDVSSLNETKNPNEALDDLDIC